MAAKLGDCRKLGKFTELKSFSKGQAAKFFFFCSYLFYGAYLLAMLVGSVENGSRFQKLNLNLIGFPLFDLSEPIWCHSSLPVCLIKQ